MKAIRHIGLVILALLFSAQSRAIPALRLQGPVGAVSIGHQFSVGVFVDGVTAVDPILGPEEFLAFGFNISYTHDLVVLSPGGVSIAAPFSDDTPLLGGPFGGSIFPGMSGHNIPIATLTFQALGEGTATIGVSDQPDSPLNTGLFTTLARYPISASFDVRVVGQSSPLPDQASTACLFALALTAVVLLRRSRP